jgi:putative ATPase
VSFLDLFSYDDQPKQGAPLAVKMRPRTLDEFIGQEHIIGPGKPMRKALEEDRIASMIFYGPPGTGKTTLAHIISNRTNAEFVRLNAVDATLKEVREVIDQASDAGRLYGKRTILFLDEVHRFNRSRQDALLPAVEAGTIILIGATTENPFHSVNSALLSRATIHSFQSLTQRHVVQALNRAISDAERGLGGLSVEADLSAIEYLAHVANGDIRRALSILEYAVTTASYNDNGAILLSLKHIEETIQKPIAKTDESTQYDVLSAFHKSIRGSSDAALYWFFLAVEHMGMDPQVFLRRLVVACSEDIGLANPQAMPQAVAAWEAYEKIGWPESKFIISQAIMLAVESPKSNAITVAIGRVQQILNENPNIDVPLHLRDTHYKGAEKLGHKGYLYPHDFSGHYVQQSYLPNPLDEEKFYTPTEQGSEAKIKANQQFRHSSNGRS